MRLSPTIVCDAYVTTGRTVAVNQTDDGEASCPIATVALANGYVRSKEPGDDDDRLRFLASALELSDQYLYGFLQGWKLGKMVPIASTKKLHVQFQAGCEDGSACRDYFNLRGVRNEGRN